MASRYSKVFSLSLAQGVLTLVGVVSGMAFSRYLSINEYATYLQTFLAYDFITPMLTLGLPSVLFYFLPDSNSGKRLVLENILLLAFVSVLFSLFLFFGGIDLLAEKFHNKDLEQTLNWIICYPLYTCPIVLGAVLVIKNKVTLNACYNLITGLVLTLTLIICVYYTRTYELPMKVKIFLPLLFFPIATYLSFKYVGGKFELPRMSSMYSMLKFAVPLGFASILGTLTIQLGSIAVSSICSPGDFAIYSNGAKEVPFIGIITGSISVILMADMASACKKGELNQVQMLMRRSALLSALMLFPIMIFLFIFSESFVTLLFSSKYTDSVLPFQIYLFFLPVRILYYGPAFIALGKTKLIFYRSLVGLILAIILCYFFTEWFGYIGAAVAIVAVSYLWAIPYNLYKLAKELKCRIVDIIPFKELAKVILVSIIAGVCSIPALYFSTNNVIILMTGALIFGFLYFALSYKYIFEFQSISKYYIQIIAKKTQK